MDNRGVRDRTELTSRAGRVSAYATGRTVDDDETGALANASRASAYAV